MLKGAPRLPKDEMQPSRGGLRQRHRLDADTVAADEHGEIRGVARGRLRGGRKREKDVRQRAEAKMAEERARA